MKNDNTKYPWIYAKGNYTNVDVFKLPFPLQLGDNYYKDIEGLTEGFFNWSSESRIDFYKKVKAGSKTCDCGAMFVYLGDETRCDTCITKEKNDAIIEEKKQDAEAEVRQEFATLLDKITFPIEIAGQTMTGRNDVIKLYNQAGYLPRKRNLIFNLETIAGVE
jgi:hypothetical protein